MAYYSSLPLLDGLYLEACQPYYSRYQVPHRESQKARRCAPASSTPAAPAAPSFNASETADAYKLYIALPGVDRKDVNVNINNGVLQLEANRPADAALDQFRTVPAKLRRTWKVPTNVDASGIRAKLANGELVISLPKVAKAEPRQVLISASEEAPRAAPAAAAAPAVPEPTAAAPKATPADERTPATAEAAPPAEGQDVKVQPPTEANVAAAADAAPAKAADEWVSTDASHAEGAHEAAAAAHDAAHSNKSYKEAAAEGATPAKGADEAAAAKSEEDGSVEDLSDEEREAERAARRRKALAAEAGPVLMETEEAPAAA